jgi:hypothetical protein
MQGWVRGKPWGQPTNRTVESRQDLHIRLTLLLNDAIEVVVFKYLEKSGCALLDLEFKFLISDGQDQKKLHPLIVDPEGIEIHRFTEGRDEEEIREKRGLWRHGHAIWQGVPPMETGPLSKWNLRQAHQHVEHPLFGLPHVHHDLRSRRDAFRSARWQGLLIIAHAARDEGPVLTVAVRFELID